MADSLLPVFCFFSVSSSLGLLEEAQESHNDQSSREYDHTLTLPYTCHFLLVTNSLLEHSVRKDVRISFLCVM